MFNLPIQHGFRRLDVRWHATVAAEVFQMSYVDPVVVVRPLRQPGKRSRLERCAGMRLVFEGAMQ